MPSRPTTRWQVSGYRFLVRRMEHALVRRDVRMLHDPMRSQSRAYTVGLILGVVALAGCAVLALLKPQGTIGNSKILMGKESGQIYAVIDGTVHPALNLASARLAVGDASSPASVKESQLSSKPMGALIGIPGAPSLLTFDSSGNGRQWTVCDELKTDGTNTLTSTAIAGGLTLGDKGSKLPKNSALLVQGKDGIYLIYDNKRARVSMDRSVTDALGITGETPRPISQGLLNSIPEVLSIVAPTITDPGGTSALADHRNGDVVQLGTDNQYFVALENGIQQISPLTADIIRNSNPTAGNGQISPYGRTHTPIVNTLPVQDYPDTAPKIVESKDQPVECMSWKPLNSADKSDGSMHAELSLVTGHALPIPDGSKPVRLAQADNSGSDKADQFYTTPGTGILVQTTGIEPDSQRKDAVFFISDTGVRYGLKDADAEKALGMDSAKTKYEPAPWPIVGLLASGPTLSRQDAMVAHDGVAPDANPARTLVSPTSAAASN
ncbi:type VII secretion protein EccB [Nocardia jiangxiensis]|uniref:Type VII secretion protein EccB n=1 Tax=Nocardia jiangxiensis TaxID=282685 RepID=A0ABW6RRL9_9NOCA|nr:type VII secretion protein EccB [Nocardia jiangxiensis]